MPSHACGHVTVATRDLPTGCLMKLLIDVLAAFKEEL